MINNDVMLLCQSLGNNIMLNKQTTTKNQRINKKHKINYYQLYRLNE